LQQFLAYVAEKVGNQTCVIFPPHLNIASALPEETGNPEIASFHLNAACFLPKNIKHITQSELKHPSLSK